VKILVWLFILILWKGNGKTISYILALNGSPLTLWTLLGLGHEN